MIVQEVPHVWSSDAMLNKAQLYAEVMLTFPHDDWKFTLWSSLSLELLARAALSNISPALLADSKGSWHNIVYSLGYQPTVSKFNPRSIDVSEVFGRLQELVLEFNPDMSKFCVEHLSRRNEELHSGARPFEGMSQSSWLPDYYQACAALLGSLDSSLEEFFGSSESTVAEFMIEAANDESAKSVQQAINARRLVWEENSIDDKQLLENQSTSWATRQDGHRAPCPACKCVAILSGIPAGPPLKTILEDEITETQEYLPTRFECIACGLKIGGLSKLSAAGLSDRFNAKFTYDISEIYVPEDYYGDYEPDFNEP